MLQAKRARASKFSETNWFESHTKFCGLNLLAIRKFISLIFVLRHFLKGKTLSSIHALN